MLAPARLSASQPYRPTVRIRRAPKRVLAGYPHGRVLAEGTLLVTRDYRARPLVDPVRPVVHRGAVLRAWRLRLGLTQPAIGKRAGLAARTVSWIEHHGRGPSLEKLERALEMVEWERCRRDG